MIQAILTIDDIPSKITKPIVDYLVSKHITPIMFLVGNTVDNYEEEALYAIQNGMIVGNHSYSHPHFSDLTMEECISEIDRCEDILDCLYDEANTKREYRPFRFPYGDKGGNNYKNIQKYLKDNGFDKVDDRAISYPWYQERNLSKDIDTYWTFNFMEYDLRPEKNYSMEDIYNRIKDKNPKELAPLLVDGTNHIIIIHAHDDTEAFVPGYFMQLMDYIIENGVEFIKPEFFKR